MCPVRSKTLNREERDMLRKPKERMKRQKKDKERRQMNRVEERSMYKISKLFILCTLYLLYHYSKSTAAVLPQATKL